ncbi:V-type ATPase subunit [Caldivirga maquilingensis]|uniref:H+-ATPase subunit C-like protein n=1 Tax=Caldivirga maquilingensis (strain ATCC 700844 / DSM 13496 / JCM 10307 / IC-167) TaxID=397948 RepID=A8MC47_CALMQ|nr:V-type ATPase subunit [Caldivirga maquilingensis]ABW01353.1 H+-ATPase subunit C-like protein [Caldivirga maquilingensis IC-167]
MWVVRNPYIGPRVRGVKARLISMDQLRNMIFSTSVDDFLSLLAQTSYRGIADKITRETPPEVASELIQGLVVNELWGMASTMPVEVKDALKTYLLKYEIENIKAVVRLMVSGQFSRERAEKVIRWYFEDALGRRFILVDLLNASNVDELASRLAALRHQSHEYLLKAMDIARNNPGFDEVIFETMLDRSWLEPLLKAADPIPQVSSFMVDFFNINVALRSKLWNLPVQVSRALMISSGIGVELERRLQEDTPRILEYLAGDPIVSRILSSGFNELSDVVRYLHVSYFTTYRRFASTILNMGTEFSPASALAMVHLRDLEAQVLSSIYNIVWSNAPRSIREKMYLLLIS